MKHTETLCIRNESGRAVLVVKAVPNSSRDRIAGPLGNALKITTAAAPEKGKANAAITRTLARALDIGKKDVQIVSGETAPLKEFRVALSVDQLRDRLAKL
jgi:hypothetical protein